MCSRNTLATACVIARLPAVCSTITRSPGRWKTVVFRNVLIWSTPALVRESDKNTSPVSSSIATQYVIVATVPRTPNASNECS
jgi:hypothetical protein